MTELAQGAEDAAITGVPRRQALCGMVALGVLGSTTLAACSSDDEFGKSSGAASPSTAASAAPPPAGGGALATLAEIPQGGGKIATTPDGQPIVIVRGNDGTVKAFSAKCTHQGTTVGAPAEGTITCPNHGSKFSATDGSVTKGPAAAPLPEVKVQVQGENITLA